MYSLIVKISALLSVMIVHLRFCLFVFTANFQKQEFYEIISRRCRSFLSCWRIKFDSRMVSVSCLGISGDDQPRLSREWDAAPHHHTVSVNQCSCHHKAFSTSFPHSKLTIQLSYAELIAKHKVPPLQVPMHMLPTPNKNKCYNMTWQRAGMAGLLEAQP